MYLSVGTRAIVCLFILNDFMAFRVDIDGLAGCVVYFVRNGHFIVKACERVQSEYVGQHEEVNLICG